jgi:ankyrin repeat protein
MLALLDERFDAAQLLLDEGADIHYTRQAPHTRDRSRGQTALWWAASKGHLPLTQRLVELGADVNLPDDFGSTPAIQAASNGHLPVLQYLVNQGADLQAKISDGRKAFHLAVREGYTVVVEFLLANGANPNERGSSGYTALMSSAENNDVAMAGILLAHNAEVDARHTGSGIYTALKGWTPLVFAVNGGYARMVRLLLQAGANPNLSMPATSGPRGEPLPKRQVLDFVKGKRGESIARILQEAGAKLG